MGQWDKFVVLYATSQLIFSINQKFDVNSNKSKRMWGPLCYVSVKLKIVKERFSSCQGMSQTKFSDIFHSDMIVSQRYISALYRQYKNEETRGSWLCYFGYSLVYKIAADQVVEESSDHIQIVHIELLYAFECVPRSIEYNKEEKMGGSGSGQ